MVAFLFSVHT